MALAATVEKAQIGVSAGERLASAAMADELMIFPRVLAAAEIKEDEELPDLESTERKLERLKKERDNMGPVNLRADMEAQEVGEQIESLLSERSDLEAAIAYDGPDFLIGLGKPGPDGRGKAKAHRTGAT